MDGKPLIYQFDDVQVDVGRFEVLKADTRAHLEPKAFEVLVFLIDHRGRLVEKKELLDAVWKEAFVTENAMTRVIAQLRKALGDDSKEAKYIETVPTRGYRFIPEVEVREKDENTAVHSGGGDEQTDLSSHLDPSNAEYLLRQIRRHKIVASAVLAIAVALVVYLLWPRPPIDSIAVLPFANVTGEPNMEYLSDGIPRGIIDRLSQVSSLQVMSFDSVVRYKGNEISPQAAGRELGVRAIVRGRVAQSSDDLAISTELIDVEDNTVIWRQAYNRKLSDILAVQTEISQEISQKLRLRLRRGAGSADQALYRKRRSVSTLCQRAVSPEQKDAEGFREKH